MKRRTFCCTFVGLVVSPLPARSQPALRKARIGFLAEPPPDQVMLRTVAEPFRQGLRELGYVEGQNVSIEQAARARTSRCGEVRGRAARLGTKRCA